ncbi:MAG TPA: carboxylesterase family protein [Rhizomicrobium sp.]|nr:carboxylesterase family protein [Rhizomicrobium sp.]
MKTLPKSLALAALLALPAAAEDVPHIRVAQGELAGFKDRGADAYLDIPFGAAPVGDLRWKAPAPPPAWQGVRDATKFGPACMQQDAKPQAPWSIEYFVAPPYSEDCLSLNVWTTPGKGKAVALFIPGGGFNQGGGGVPIYNGAEIAKAGIVFVTMNYRLSAAGFLASSALAAESSSHASGDYTLMDILAALHWLHENAATFGGDPGKITVMGQSAGAAAIVALLHSPQAKGLFRGAIIDSGVRAGARTAGNAERERMSTDWAASLGATSLDQMRALPASALIPVKGTPFHFAPSTDGAVLPDGPILVDVPILTGWNAGEGSVGSGRLLTTPVNRADFEKQENTALGANAPSILALYPSGADAQTAARQAGHDATMMGGAAWAAARPGHAPLYYYDFEHVMPGDTAADWGSYHSSELPYVFNTLHVLNRPWTETDTKVGALLQAYWVNFIKTGDPNGDALPHWAAFDAAKDEVMALGPAPHMRPIAEPARIQAFNRAFSN